MTHSSRAKPKTFFSAGQHLGHANIIRNCRRPHGSIREMDEDLVARWNAVVSPEDTVWHLGDLVVEWRGDPEAYLARLNGQLHLVPGNHCPRTRLCSRWLSVQDIAHITVDGRRLVLCHWSMRTWQGRREPGHPKGAINLYGHSHGNLPDQHDACDVGVDALWTRGAPVELSQVLDRLKAVAAGTDPSPLVPQRAVRQPHGRAAQEGAGDHA